MDVLRKAGVKDKVPVKNTHSTCVCVCVCVCVCSSSWFQVFGWVHTLVPLPGQTGRERAHLRHRPAEQRSSHGMKPVVIIKREKKSFPSPYPVILYVFWPREFYAMTSVDEDHCAQLCFWRLVWTFPQSGGSSDLPLQSNVLSSLCFLLLDSLIYFSFIISLQEHLLIDYSHNDWPLIPLELTNTRIHY